MLPDGVYFVIETAPGDFGKMWVKSPPGRAGFERPPFGPQRSSSPWPFFGPSSGRPIHDQRPPQIDPDFPDSTYHYDFDPPPQHQLPQPLHRSSASHWPKIPRSLFHIKPDHPLAWTQTGRAWSLPTLRSPPTHSIPARSFLPFTPCRVPYDGTKHERYGRYDLPPIEGRYELTGRECSLLW